MRCEVCGAKLTATKTDLPFKVRRRDRTGDHPLRCLSQWRQGEVAKEKETRITVGDVLSYLASGMRKDESDLVQYQDGAERSQARASAVLSFAAVSGTRRRRTPVASKIALARAAGTGVDAASPTPSGG